MAGSFKAVHQFIGRILREQSSAITREAVPDRLQSLLGGLDNPQGKDMPTLTELIVERADTIAKFKDDIYSHQEHDISELNEALLKTPITSKEDALAALTLIRSEAAEPEQPLILGIASALTAYLNNT
jgi:hypothetical protein